MSKKIENGEEKCSNCGITKTKTFWDYDDGTFLCDKCEKKIGAEWLEEHNKLKNKKMPLGIKIFLAISVFGFLVYIASANIEIVYLVISLIIFIITVLGINSYKKWTPAFYLISSVVFATLYIGSILITYKIDISLLSPFDIMGVYIAPVFWGIVLFSYQKSYFKN